jgi:hypothetical protein
MRGKAATMLRLRQQQEKRLARKRLNDVDILQQVRPGTAGPRATLR